ncbi:MAG: TIGR00282 family metallophosphoesterase [Desulfovibrionaceae bacterium]
MRILCLGDVVGDSARKALRDSLQTIRVQYAADCVIVNGENASGGRGITLESYKELLHSGVDIITTGNHVWQHKNIYGMLEDPDAPIIVPANYPLLGKIKGFIYMKCYSVSVLVVNLIGRIFMQPVECPFATIETILDVFDKKAIVIVDFHAEATSEKRAMAFFLDGRVSALFGTHTHVQTNDATILDKGTGYITDLGMCGVENSVLGAEAHFAIERLRSSRFKYLPLAKGTVSLQGVLFDIDEITYKTVAVDTIRMTI